MDHVPRVGMTGPLAPYRDFLWSELLSQGYAVCSAVGLIRVAAHLSAWLHDAHLSATDLTRVRIEEYLEQRRASRKAWITAKGLAPILKPLRALSAVPPAEPAPVDRSPVGRLLRDYETYLLEARGMQLSTGANYCGMVRSFLEGLHLLDVSELECLRADVVSRFIVREARSSSVGHLKVKVTALRAFLRYLHVSGLCRDLSAAVPAVASRLCSLPRAIPEDAVRRIEASCDRETATGRRDYAIVLLMSRLAIRSGEVVALELDDVRWSQGEVVVRGKGSEGVLPLPHAVGAAVVDYLKAGRPISASRRIFLRAVAPHHELTGGAVGAVVRSACKRAGLPPIGSHRLRHSAATLMLRKGASLSDIAQVLRHRSLETTAIYAKVDHLALRPLARPWLGGGA